MNINTCMESRRMVLMNLFAAASMGCRHSTHSWTQQGKESVGRTNSIGTYTSPRAQLWEAVSDPGSSSWCSATTQRDRMGWSRREVQEGVTNLHLRPIHVAAWQKPTRHHKAITLQLKHKFKNKLLLFAMMSGVYIKIIGEKGV